jgi:hypothetical protein
LGKPFPWLSFFALVGFGLVFFLGCLLALKRTNV